MQIRVYYEDTDTGGVVYHSNYLNFCERARSDAFFVRGESPVLQRGHFVARRLSAEYYASAKLGDLLTIKSELIEMRAASFKLKQSIFRDGVRLFELEIVLAYITFDAKPQKIDTETKAQILSLFEK